MTIMSPLINVFSNGQVADATAVVADMNAMIADCNANAAHNGANSDITSLTGLTTALSIGQGGTGQTTSALALAALGGAARGANTDITSLGGLTTALSVAQGGTGATTAAAALTALGGAGLTITNLFTASQRGQAHALTSSGASVAWDMSLGNYCTLSMTENTTLAAPTNAVFGQSGFIIISQNGSAAKTLGYNSVYKFPSATVPSLTTTLSATDVLAYFVVSSTQVLCNLLKGFG